jgi:uncharacterized membrane protein
VKLSTSFSTCSVIRIKTISLVVVCLLAACGVVSNARATVPVVDESSINKVWHKAKQRGVSFRAIGQEPGWLLEITTGREILVVLDYGQTRLSLPYIEPIVHNEESRTEFVLDSSDTIIEIRGEPCRDTMSGEQFSESVTITLIDRSLEGCGRALH